MENERCCGHDLLWSGDRDNFIKLARLNAKAIEETGAEETPAEGEVPEDQQSA